MRVLVRRIDTNAFYAGDNVWTAHATLAHNFASLKTAAEFTRTLESVRISELFVVLKYSSEERRQDVSFPAASVVTMADPRTVPAEAAQPRAS